MTYIEYVLDASGSMAGLYKDALLGFNAYVEDQKRQKDSRPVKFSLTTFNTAATTLFADKPLESVEPLTEKLYVTTGGTALLDAIGAVINRRRYSVRPQDTVLVVIMTDGEENSSRVYNNSQIKEMITELQTKNFTFTYVGANQDAWHVAQQFGVPIGNTIKWEVKNAEASFRGMSNVTSSLRSSYSAGVMNTSNLYNSAVDIADLAETPASVVVVTTDATPSSTDNS